VKDWLKRNEILSPATGSQAVAEMSPQIYLGDIFVYTWLQVLKLGFVASTYK
jgi:hypothetical protein